MTNPFTAHPRQQVVAYLAHLCFAMGIAYRLWTSVAVLALHALLPIVPIAPRLDLEPTGAFVEERNRRIETAKATVDAGARPALAELDETGAMPRFPVTQP
jgi:hypothetical protein